MTLEEMIAKLRTRLAELATQRQTHVQAIQAVRSAYTEADRDPTDDEASRLRAAVEARDGIDEQITDAQGRIDEMQRELDGNAAAQAILRDQPDRPQQRTHSPARVTDEQRTYTAEKCKRGEASFFIDAFRMQHNMDPGARDRLERHASEVLAEGEFSERAVNTGSFAGLVIPQYLIDEYAIVARAGRKFADSVRKLALPAEGMSLVIPKGTTGAAVDIQATENSAVQRTDEVWANVTVPVVTIAGQQQVSRQTLERGTPGIDSIIYGDLASSYAVKLDQQVISGSGSSGQMLGVLNTSGIDQAAAYGAAITAGKFYSKIAGEINAVETNRFMAPTAIAMHPRRWNWMLTQTDSTGRPLVVPNQNGAMNSMGIANDEQLSPDGTMLLPVLTDANIPTNVGTESEDVALVYRQADLLLWEENGGQPRQLRFEQTLGNQLTVTLVAYGYAAFTAARYPTAVGVTGGVDTSAGDGQIAPTF